MTAFPGEDEGRPNPSTDPDSPPETRSDPDGRPAGEPDYEVEPDRGRAAVGSGGGSAVGSGGGVHPLVEETMARLADLRDRPVDQHAEVYGDLHERLQAALSEADAPGIDTAPAGRRPERV